MCNFDSRYFVVIKNLTPISASAMLSSFYRVASCSTSMFGSRQLKKMEMTWAGFAISDQRASCGTKKMFSASYSSESFSEPSPRYCCPAMSAVPETLCPLYSPMPPCAGSSRVFTSTVCVWLTAPQNTPRSIWLSVKSRPTARIT